MLSAVRYCCCGGDVDVVEVSMIVLMRWRSKRLLVLTQTEIAQTRDWKCHSFSENFLNDAAAADNDDYSDSLMLLLPLLLSSLVGHRTSKSCEIGDQKQKSGRIGQMFTNKSSILIMLLLLSYSCWKYCSSIGRRDRVEQHCSSLRHSLFFAKKFENLEVGYVWVFVFIWGYLFRYLGILWGPQFDSPWILHEIMTSLLLQTAAQPSNILRWYQSLYDRQRQ